MNWQPIATAPKDQPILVYDTTEGMMLVEWLMNLERPEWCDPFSWQEDGYCTADHATHWMPLPPPPEA